MGLTLLRQEDDIRQSDAYSAATAPSLANFQTNPTNLETDLNNIRSQLHNLLKDQAGNWYDDLNVPSTLDTGTQRGVNNLNTDLHAVERARRLRHRINLVDVTVGAGDNFVILTTGQLPAVTLAAVGAVTTVGTVVAFHAGTFGTHSLDEVGGSSAITPKNLCVIVDGNTRDPLLSGGRIIYALLQSELATNGHTITDTTPNRVQLSFVRVTATGDDLEAVPFADIENKVINYNYIERVAHASLNEQDFLRFITTDTPAAATVSRQTAYDNQGATPVDLITNAILDLEGPGLFWEIRDDLEASLFRITEGSAGSATIVRIGVDVDTFDVNALVNDFDKGLTVNSGGTRIIRLGVTDGVISTVAGDLRVNGAGELFLDDGNQTGSTWAQTSGIKLSDTTAEWDAYEAAFGGEVSLLDGIVKAYNAGADQPRAFHVVQSNVAADADVGGPGTAANNLDVDWPTGFVTVGILNTIVLVSGREMRPGVDATANFDYYPGTSFTGGNVELKFERKLKAGDTLISKYNP